MISIITVSYNDLPALQQTYQSVVNLNGGAFEWIVVDGNSTDGTAKWLENLDFDALRWISEPDSGIYNAMNKGIDLAAMEYCIFMNAGDEFSDSNVLGLFISSINQNRPWLVYGDSFDVAEDGQKNLRVAKSHESAKLRMFTHHQAMLFLTGPLKIMKYNEVFKLSGDYDLVARTLCDPKATIQKVDFPICNFKLGGAHQVNRKLGLLEDFRIRRDVFHLSWLSCCFLFLAHLFHSKLKLYFPVFTGALRYKS